ncbi:methionine--tRNA ligase [Candidatus Saccharibacteria bacterium]|nr:methionine--tRNA ligase [Candidatus Saccharibacteria bacterium]
MKKVYITTAIPYVNGAPHIGHAVDYCLADVCARYFGLMGDEIRLQVGTDEHGGKIYKKAAEMGISVQDYVDKNAGVFRDFVDKLEVQYTDTVRTTDETHMKRCQEIWKRLSDHIYKAEYEGWYCTGCERFITDKEYEENDGVCPDHQKPYEKLKEENYYLRIADFKKQINEAIESDRMKILPEFRKKEIIRLLDDSPDVSISRPTSQLTWGVPVPGDDTQVMYVWMDALANYITVLGYPDKEIKDWWPAKVQIVGKDVLRFHAIIWPAILLGLGLELPQTILSHGMILADGQKMSKSVGNVVEPMEVIEKHGLEAFRYYFLRHVDTFNDSDFTWAKFEEAYNNELANELGNLVQRLATLAQKNEVGFDAYNGVTLEEYRKLMDGYEFSKAFDVVWAEVQALNRRIDAEKPWALAKEGRREELEQCLQSLMRGLIDVAAMLKPFLPKTAEAICGVFGTEVRPLGEPLFPKH